MLVIGAQDAVNLLRFFDDLPDPRSSVNRLHRLGDVIVMAICAIVANADGPTAIAQWAKLNEAWLRRHLALPGGIPGKDTFRRVLGLLPPATFQQCFQQWLHTLQTTADEEAENKKHIAIDGKALRRSCPFGAAAKSDFLRVSRDRGAGGQLGSEVACLARVSR